MLKHFYACLLLFLLLPGLSALAQDYILDTKYYGIKEGLSHRDIQCIAQDTQGFIWMGTKYGLNRFDGYRFKWYTKENAGLQSNEINHILKDKLGKFWLINTGAFFRKAVISIDIFDPVTEEIKTFEQYFGEKKPFAAQDIACFNQDEQNEILFFTNDGHLSTFDGTFHLIENGLDQNGRIENIHRSPTGFFWLINFLPSADPRKEECTLQLLAPNGRLLKNYYDPGFDFIMIYEFDQTGSCRFIQSKVNKNNGFFKITPDQIRHPDTLAQKAFSRGKLDSQPFTQLSKIKKKYSFFWVIGGGNLPSENPISGIVDFNRMNGKNPWEEKFKEVAAPTDMVFDKSGKLWISTQFGLYLLQLKTNHFKKYFNDFEGRKPPIRGLAMDDSRNLWIVEEKSHNLLKLNLDTKKESSANLSETKQNHLPFFELFYTIAKAKTNHLYYQSKNDIIKFDPTTYEYSKLKTWDKERSIGPIWAIYEDDEEKLWLAPLENQLCYLENGNFHELPPLDNETTHTTIYQFFKSGDGITWLPTDIGLFTLDLKTKKILDRYWSGGKGKYYLPFDKIFHICEDSDGTFWLGSGGAGLLHWNRGKPLPSAQNNLGTKNYTQYTTLHGLSNNNIYAVYPDDFGNLWLSSDYGIMRFNKKTLQIQAYLKEDGITDNEFNRIAHFKTSDGTIFFGGLNGVTAFHPKDFSADTLVLHPSLVITQFQQFDGSKEKLVDKTASVRRSATITMAPDDRFFLLEFSLLTFDNTDKIQYAYLVEGVDKDWIYQKESSLRFSRLPYGNHTLRVKGQTASGLWSQNELRLTVHVLKPFYIQTWFLVTLGVLVFAGSFTSYRWRVSSLKSRQAELEKIVKERTSKIEADKMIIEEQAEELKSLEKLKSRFFANVSHELRTPLTLMLGPVNSLIKKKKDGEEKRLLEFIHRNARQLQKLINEILDLSKLENNKLEVIEEPVVFYSYLKDLLSQFHSLGQATIVFDFRANRKAEIMLDTKKFEKIIYNFLSNALKFTPPDGRVKLIITETPDTLKISVTDTGRGIHPNDLPHIFDRFYQSNQPDAPTEGGTGIGLSLVKELAELLGGKVWAESEWGKGSTFYFEISKKIAGEYKDAVLSETASPEIIIPEENATLLPIAEAQNSAQSPQTHHEERPTLLVVEDNPDLRAYLQYVLSDYQVLTAENGMAALECLAQNPDCQLIISDLMMPVMNGFEFLETAKSDDRWRSLPFIMLTAKVNIHDKLKALRIGVDDYLTKPFEEEELKVRIENLLRNYHERAGIRESAELVNDEEPPAEESFHVDKNQVTEQDSAWLETLESLLREEVQNDLLSVNWMANKMYMSERQLLRRLKILTGLNPSQYIKEVRLQEGRRLLETGKARSVKEAAFSVNFKDEKYFAVIFRERFGRYPSELL